MLRIFSSVLLSLLLLASACRSRIPATTAEDRPVPVRLRRPQQIEQPAWVSASGSVEAALSVEAAFQVPGRVARVLVEEGQMVSRGQLLAELDDADYRHGLAAAAAQSEAARAAAEKARSGLRRQELEQARIDYEHWADQYRRMKLLFDRRSLPLNDFKKVEAAFEAARERYDLAREGARREDIQAAEAAARAAEAQLEVARKKLEDTRLLAPAGGFIGLRRVDPGETIAAGMPAFVILDLDPVKVRAGIPEAEIGKVRPGARALVRIPSLDRQEFTGRVELVGVAADPASRTYPVRIAVPNPQHLLRAGMVAEVRIEGAVRVKALTLPGEAIDRDVRGETRVFVYSPERKRVYARRVEVGEPAGAELEILSGLSGEEQVVVAGRQNVREGSLVEVEGGRP